MASQFRQKKYIHAFKTFFDVDGSGNIGKSDFDEALKKIAAFRNWPAGSASYNETKQTLEQVWEGLKARGDKDNDGQVSQDEWVALWDEFARNPSSPADWQKAYSKFIFQVVDTGADGAVDSAEFSSLYGAFGLDKGEAAAAFQKASGGKAVNFEAFQKLWNEYFSSDDVNAAGNFIFGKSSF